MGKKSYSKWLARLLRLKKPGGGGDPAGKCFTDDGKHAAGAGIAMDPSKYAIALEAATAAVAEAALVTAKAAAEVVRLTSRGGGAIVGNGEVSGRWWWSVQDYLAAVRIQSAFRGYLARRALRALKGLVKLQALVRGYFVRKRSADMLRRMQAMGRLQARARANRLKNVETAYSGPERYRKHDHQHRASSRKLSGSSSLMQRCRSVSRARDASSMSRLAQIDDENADMILEIDSCWPHLTSNISQNYQSSNVSVMDYYYDTHAKYSVNLNLQSGSPCNSESVVSLSSLNLPPLEPDFSPEACSVPPRPGSSHGKGRTFSPFTPTRNECSRSLYAGDGHMGAYYPNYMANTESSWAKLRSHSAPRQRIEWFESHGSSKRLFAHGNDFRVLRSYSKRNPDSCTARSGYDLS